MAAKEWEKVAARWKQKVYERNDQLKSSQATNKTLTEQNARYKGVLDYIDKHFTCPCDSQPSGCGDNPKELCGFKQIVIGHWLPQALEDKCETCILTPDACKGDKSTAKLCCKENCPHAGFWEEGV